MVKIRWTRESVSDLKGIHDYIARDSEYYARNEVEKLCEFVDKLKRFPKMGRRLAEFPHLPHREIIVNSYRVIYRYETNKKTIHIVAIVHGRQKIQKKKSLLH